MRRGPSRKFIKNLETMSMDAHLTPAERLAAAELLGRFCTSALTIPHIQTIGDLKKEFEREDELAELLKETYGE
jgi:hypothetical protein